MTLDVWSQHWERIKTYCLKCPPSPNLGRLVTAAREPNKEAQASRLVPRRGGPEAGGAGAHQCSVLRAAQAAGPQKGEAEKLSGQSAPPPTACALYPFHLDWQVPPPDPVPHPLAPTSK